MSIMDVLQETIKNQSLISPAGDSICFGFLTGVVVEDSKAYDPDEYPGKVKVKFLTREKDKNLVIWVPVVMPAGGENHGFFFTPEVGDVVLIGFGDGNFSKPYVMGCLYKAKDKVPKNSADKDNNIKKIITRGGNEIIFSDEVDKQANKDKCSITIKTKEGLMIKMENEEKLITVTDKDKKNKIVLDSPNGQITVLTEKKIEIKSGNSTSIVLDGENNSITAKSQSIKIEAQNDLTLKGATVKVDGSNSLGLSGGSTAKLESTGTTKIGGATVKLG